MAALAVSMGATVALQFINMGTGILLARTFDPTGRGELAAVLLWPMLIGTIGLLGVFEAVGYYTARRQKPLGTIVGSSLAVAIAWGALFTAIGAAVLPIVLHRHDPEVLHSAYTFLPYIPLSIFSMTLLGVLNGLHRDHAFQAMRVLVIAAAAVLLVGFAIAGHLTIQTTVWSYLGGQVATAIWTIRLVRQSNPRPLRIDRDMTRKVVRYGLLSHSGSVSAQLNQRLDLLVVSIFLSARDLGLYTIAFTLTTAAFVIGWSVAYVVLPRVAAAKHNDQVVLARRSVSLTFWASTLVAVPFLALMPELVKLFFGSAYSPATDISRVLLIGAIVLGTTRALEAVLRGLGRPFEAGLAEIISLAVTVAGLATLLPAMGLMGAAIASLIAYTTSMLVMLERTRAALHVPVRVLLIPSWEDIRLLQSKAAAALRFRRQPPASPSEASP
jgi:O-antigen/teichoic acid export membrane protein